MSQFTFFPNMHWCGVTLHFPQNDLHSLLPSQTETPKSTEASDTFTQAEAEKARQSPLADAGFDGERRALTLNLKQKDLHSLPPSSWTVTRKISEASDSYTQEDAEYLCQFPVADARFECANVENPNNKAILEVYMEIPCVDTQGPAEGTYGTPYSVETILEAHKLLTLHNSKYSPRLMQYMQGTQTSEHRRFFMPGGRIYYMITSKLPGVPLGNRLISHTEDGRIFVEGLFWKLSRVERDQIRGAFQDAYLEHIASKVTVVPKNPSRLLWDQESGNVYMHGEFRPLLGRKLDDYGPEVLDLWMLALAPKGEIDYNVPMAELEQNGWLL